MKAKLWDESARAYSDVEVPDGCSCYEDDMDAIVTCAGCGKSVKFDSSYTSRRFYLSGYIWGLAVCPSAMKRS